MGATTFMTKSKGKTAEEAFRAAVRHAQYMHGHGGYTGSIAEKRSFVTIPTGLGPQDRIGVNVAQEKANELINKDDPRVRDKWGPAGCIALGGDEYLFFGWASE